MQNLPTTSLSLSRLTCQIPNHQDELLKLIGNRSNNKLYIEFVQKFLSYIHVDYREAKNLAHFGEFTEQAFSFFQSRKLGEKKIEILLDTFEDSPSVCIMLLNDDRPFIVDSLNCLLSRLKLQAKFIFHPIISVNRDNTGLLVSFNEEQNEYKESMIYLKILGKYDEKWIASLKQEISIVLDYVYDVGNSWYNITKRVQELALDIENKKALYEKSFEQVSEPVDFLSWLQKNNFTFLGILDFQLSGPPQKLACEDEMLGDLGAQSPSILNIHEDSSTKSTQQFTSQVEFPIRSSDDSISNQEGASSIWRDNTSELAEIIKLSGGGDSKNQLTILGKINKISPIHKASLIDYILIKKVNAQGQFDSGTIILGLYGSAMYYQSISNIPILRQKLNYVLSNSSFAVNGYSYKKLKIIIESLPREALVQISEEDLLCMSLHMLSAILSKKLKFFAQQDWSSSFINILIFLPKERLTPDVHNKINQYLTKAFTGNIISEYMTDVAQSFSYLFTTIAVNHSDKNNVNLAEVEKDIDIISTSWGQSFYKELCNKIGEYQGSLDFHQFEGIFETDYRHKFNAQNAVEDLAYLKQSSLSNQKAFNLITKGDTNFELKIYSPESQVSLSDILPFIENLGFKAIDEDSFQIKASHNNEIKDSWIYRFILSVPTEIDLDAKFIKHNVEEALLKMSLGVMASDSLCKLIALSGFNWFQVKIMKALTRYLHQTGFTYGKGYVQLVLIKHNKFTELLISLFEAKFQNKDFLKSDKDKLISSIMESIAAYLKKVTSSTEDKVLNTVFHIIEAITRTNCYQTENKKNYLSFKFNSSKVPGLPLPVPYAEIFVYSNEFEGIHLRGGKVARGGLRWSDRGEDYRTEVLGLMKAQMTKNAVIVPVGSKGGFFVHVSPDGLTKEDYMAKIVECYKSFLRGLLDITDNIVDGKIVHPQNTQILDGEDPYLVVAADKGTASFSDYANSVSAEYGFWLGDAFASGGSAGYDHKKMAITAKGAWISVQRHFAEIGIDVQKDPIKVVGIGDMSGDVFGNGMLRSKAIKLVAAFNHKHIFIDPDPEPAASYLERERLFNLPGSGWSDYNPELISNGGGVFERSAKTITLTSEIKQLLGLRMDSVAPEELIRGMLKAPVDLIWNGGIGTYIKASTENNLDVGDKTNDNLRCDAKAIKAKVFAEGGNLGVSQKGRIEYAKINGKINADFIDNSAGVDCSDHEVNIKIALGSACTSGKLSLEERNKLLSEMTAEVENLVLLDNYKQTEAITISQLSPAYTVEMFSRLIESLEEEKLLDREVEFLPNKTELSRRSLAKESLTRPELAVLLSYSKMSLYNGLAAAALANDRYFDSELINYFPEKMHDRFKDEILAHPLRKEIIRTVVTNKMVNQLGGALISNIKYETGAALCDIARSYTIICEIFNLDPIWAKVSNLPPSIDINVKIEMFTELAKVMRRGISWFIKHLEHPIDIVKTIGQFKEASEHLSTNIGNLLVGEAKNKFDLRLSKYKEIGIEDDLATAIVSLDSLISAFDIIFIANNTKAKDLEVAKIYFSTANRFKLDWLRKECEKQMNDSYWNRLSIQSLKDDLYDKQRRLLIKIIEKSNENPVNLDLWLSDTEKDASIFFDFIEDIKILDSIDLNIIILANKKLELFLRKL